MVARFWKVRKKVRLFRIFQEFGRLHLLLLIALIASLSGCLDTVWSGASMAYDRHNIYRKIDDFQLAAAANRALFYKDATFVCKNCSVDIAAFNGDILLAGAVPDIRLRKEAALRMKKLPEVRHVYNEISVGVAENSAVEDAWITSKIRSQIFADSRINPSQFKVVTAQHVVYLMGDVLPDQASLVVYYARNCVGVNRVVKLLKYYKLSNTPK